MYEKIYSVVDAIDGAVWGWGMILLLLGTHVFMTIRTRGIQRKLGTGIRLSVSKDEEAEGEVSQFGALTTALAATIGTGNIIGVGTAIALGGPGAVFWCWLTGVFGIATKYSESLISVKYRVENQGWTDAGRRHVCPGERAEYEMAGPSVCHFRRIRFLWNRLCHAGERHRYWYVRRI